MDELKQRIAYLHGLAEGLVVEQESKEGKVLTSIIEVLGDLAQSVESLRVAQNELENYVESIDEDLGDLEDEVFDDEDHEYVEVHCPKCQDTVYFEADLMEDDDVIEITCPNCNEVVFINDPPFTLEDHREEGRNEDI